MDSFAFVAVSAAVLAIGIVGYGMSNLVCAWLTAIARNPEASDKLSGPGYVGIGLVEAAVLMCVLIALIPMFVVGVDKADKDRVVKVA